jgi:hypothetical protein
MKTIFFPLVGLLAALISPVGVAGNVDLATVPAREAVQLTIYNSEDLTLVRERRKVSFKRGANTLQFGWANTLIDPTSVELRFPSQGEALALLDTTFPHDRPQVLYWNVHSELDGEALVEITYFTSGITWSADYVAVAAQDEQDLGLEGFVRVTNRSGEQYEDAQVRLVVGTINLVEKIAQLAQLPVSEVPRLRAELRRDYRRKAVRRAMEDAVLAAAPAAGQMEMVTEKGIVKAGLSEYFIYTVEGTETIPDGWSKRLRSFHADAVPIETVHRYRAREYGERLVRLYLLRNDTESGLGTTPLPDGKVRVFRDNGRDGLSYLATQSLDYVPIGDRIELNLGEDREVVFELVNLANARDRIWLKYGKPAVYRRLDDGVIEVDPRATVAGWDAHAMYTQRVRNFTDRPIRVEIRRRFDGHVTFRSRLDATLYDYRTVEYTASIQVGEERDLLYEVVTKRGRNAKQNNVTIEVAEIEPPSWFR